MLDFKPLDIHSLTVLKFLEPVAYTDVEGNKRLHLNPINLKEILPEAVMDYHGEEIIDWSVVTVVTVDAIAMLLDRIIELEKKISNTQNGEST